VKIIKNPLFWSGTKNQVSSGLIWCTTEISQKVFFEELIFFIALSGGLASGMTILALKDIKPRA
jgi:hypothetical protein